MSDSESEHIESTETIEKGKSKGLVLTAKEKSQVKQTAIQKRKEQLRLELEAKYLETLPEKETAKKQQASRAGKVASENMRRMREDSKKWNEYLARKAEKQKEKEEQVVEKKVHFQDMSVQELYDYMNA